MNVCDWRDADGDVLAALYEQGRQRWAADLGWDTSDTWRSLEEARTTWGLPGLLAVDDAGAVQGWTFFLPQDDLLQVGGLTARTPLATRALLDGLQQVWQESGATGLSCFMFDEAPQLAGELVRRGFAVQPFLYLVRTLVSGDGSAPSERRWIQGDLAAAAALLHASYDAATACHLAPGHTPAAWERYLRNLLERTGLGTFNPGATRVMRGHQGLDALVLVTALSEETAHIAQVAVHPSRRGQGLARRLILDACAAAAADGYKRATLLVADSNTAARELYASLGFTASSRFVAAHVEYCESLHGARSLDP